MIRYLLSALLLLGATASGQLFGQIEVVIGGQIGSPATKSPAEKKDEAAAQAALGPSLLRWSNGESLRGEIDSATASELSWKSPLFEEPLVIGWHALRRIDQMPGAKTIEPMRVSQRFQFIMRDGSHLTGRLVGVDDMSIKVQSARHGDLALKRSEVLSVRRLRGGKLLYAGPTGDEGWEPRSEVAKTVAPRAPTANEIPAAPLTTGAGGALSLPYWNRGAALKLPLPELVDLEFRVRSSGRPDFRLSLDGDPKQPLQIETWDDELVIASGDNFQLIRKIAESDREVTVRLCWNRKTGKCFVFNAAGEVQGEFSRKDDLTKPRDSLVLQNKGRDLSLELLRVREWDGDSGEKGAASKARLELADGHIIPGDVRTGTEETLTLAASGDAPEQNVALADVDAIIFSDDAPVAKETEARLSFSDGTLLFGKMDGVKDGWAALRTTIAEHPVASRLEGFRQLLLRVPTPEGTPAEPPLSQLDKITFQQSVLHGRLATTGGDRPRWIPVGGTRPSAPVPSAASEISRALPAASKATSPLSLFYTSAGDVLPGKLVSLGRDAVEFQSSYIEATKLPADQIDAIQFGASARQDIKGFDDPGWRVIKGDATTLQRTHDSLKLEPGAIFGHPSAMQSGEINFSLSSDQFSTLRMRLFCAGTETAQSMNLMILRYSDRITCGIEGSEGQFASQTQLQVPSGPAVVRLVIQERQLELYINGDLAQKFPVVPARRAGSGLVLEAASMWGNTVRSVSLTNFSAPALPGGTWMPDINAEAKSQALTVPRFRKDDPPRQALVAANGDVLRGEIEAVTGTHIGFRSGLETLKIPIERVKAAVWLKKPSPESAPEKPVSPVAKKLEKRIDRHIRYSSASLGVLVNVLDREAGGLKFQLPTGADERRVGMQFGDQTVGEALDQLCNLFDVTYRIDDNGTIVFEAGVRVPKGLQQKVYWLKPDAFPASPSAQQILTDKGIAFPNGASAVWQAKSQQLIVTTSAPEQVKLAQLLNAAFGGSLGSPTHWLLLTNGARLSLAVDKFDQTSVAGHHPLFGRCTIPVSDIYVIRTTPPAATPVMRTFQDWRLVFAPEPVIPESGDGSASPLVGKDAKPFKLPLLAGGEFDLAKEKGKIVVLDFWATWCGPCIKSLPGLIEAVGGFPSDKVELIGVNQSEAAEQVKRFVETRKWNLPVAMDAGSSVGQQYGVEGIPHTVIVGPDGKIAWVKTGYTPDGDKEAAEAIKKLLTPAPAASL